MFGIQIFLTKILDFRESFAKRTFLFDENNEILALCENQKIYFRFNSMYYNYDEQSPSWNLAR